MKITMGSVININMNMNIGINEFEVYTDGNGKTMKLKVENR